MERRGAERRKYPRLDARHMIAVSPLGADPRLAQGHDVSLGGIRFQVVGCEIDLGDLLRVFFNVEDETVSAVGRVVWATEIDAFTIDVGLEFLEIDSRTSALLGRLAAA